MVGRNGEIIEPVKFLGRAEKYGLIAELDRWVIKRVSRSPHRSPRRHKSFGRISGDHDLSTFHRARDQRDGRRPTNSSSKSPKRFDARHRKGTLLR